MVFERGGDEPGVEEEYRWLCFGGGGHVECFLLIIYITVHINQVLTTIYPPIGNKSYSKLFYSFC